MKMILLKTSIVLFYFLMLYVNYLANAKPLGGITTGEISDKYNTLFTPSGFTFSIWGLIYLLLGIFIVSNLFDNRYASSDTNIVLYLFLISTVLNGSWLFAWHNDRILLSSIIMILFLITLLSILHFIPKEDVLGYTTFSIYSGWISVALIANISILITKYDISLFMNYQWVWFILILITSVGIMITMFLRTGNYIYGMVFLWAYFGIAMKFIEK